LKHGLDFCIPQIRLCMTLRGLLPEFGRFQDAEFDEASYEQYLLNNRSLSMARSFYLIRKLQARYFAGDYTGALTAVDSVQSSLWAVPYFLELADYHYFAGLSRAALCGSATEVESEPHARALAVHAAAMRAMAVNGPDNFGSQAALLDAELARLSGR